MRSCDNTAAASPRISVFSLRGRAQAKRGAIGSMCGVALLDKL